MSDEIHIAGLVVRARVEAAPKLARRLGRLHGFEVYAVAGGKIVLTLETASETDIVRILDHLQRLRGVMAANMVYHHVEPLADLEGNGL